MWTEDKTTLSAALLGGTVESWLKDVRTYDWYLAQQPVGDYISMDQGDKTQEYKPEIVVINDIAAASYLDFQKNTF